MAPSQHGTIPKLSFAKIVAMPAPNSNVNEPKINESRRHKQSDTEAGRVMSNNPVLQPLPPNTNALGDGASRQNTLSTEAVRVEIEKLSMASIPAQFVASARSAESGDSLEDDHSNLSNSSVKQQSFDTKSVMSVTTFGGMDEKESIRPDDSASVRAVDDDETMSTFSRASSFRRDAEAQGPSVRSHPRTSSSAMTIHARRFPTLTLANPPRFGDLPIDSLSENEDSHPVPEVEVLNEIQEERPRIPAVSIAPDEKLLDALATPKDRLPLLQLEEKILGFLSQDKETIMDLPPQNSFARLLAHKLADYYSLAHASSDDSQSVRIFRTGTQAALPTQLAVLAQSIPVGSVQAPASSNFKIMRRAGLGTRQLSAGGSTAASSSVPSKATSEIGGETASDEGVSSTMETTPNRDRHKLTREEREAQYKAARERIFADYQEQTTNESVSTGENSASMSRSSSSSGKKKTRKQKTPKDDSFEARSAFVQSYGPMPATKVPQHPQSGYHEVPYQMPYANSPNSFPPTNNYGTTPTQAYPGFDAGMTYGNNMNFGMPGNQQYGMPDQWSGMQSPPPTQYYNYQQGQTYQQSPSSMMTTQMNSSMVGGYLQQPSNGMPQNSSWMAAPYPSPYAQNGNQGLANVPVWPGYATNSTSPIPNGQSYQYGQSQHQHQNYANNVPHNYQAQPTGSNPRSLFNPQTRSFVPSNTTSRNGGRGGRKKTPIGFSSGKDGMGRGDETASHSSSRVPDRAGINPTSSPKPREDSLRQKYGAPAHLPKKPPPAQKLSNLDSESIPPAAGLPVTGLNGSTGSS